MRTLLSSIVLFLSLVGVSMAQHGSHAAPHSAPPASHQESHPAATPRGAYHGDLRRGGFGNWYAARPAYRNFRWGHHPGWFYRPYAYIGPGYCYTGVWGAPYFTFGFNATRWRVVDFDFGVINGWYPGSCAYLMLDTYHDGWYLLYDQQTGQYVHVEEY